MSARLRFFFGRSPIGEATIESSWEPDIAFFCPVCGEIWGRIASDSTPAEWWSVQRECAIHSKPALLSFRTPGSLWLEERHPWDSLPPEVQVREAELMLIQRADYPA